MNLQANFNQILTTAGAITRTDRALKQQEQSNLRTAINDAQNYQSSAQAIKEQRKPIIKQYNEDKAEVSKNEDKLKEYTNTHLNPSRGQKGYIARLETGINNAKEKAIASRLQLEQFRDDLKLLKQKKELAVESIKGLGKNPMDFGIFVRPDKIDHSKTNKKGGAK